MPLGSDIEMYSCLVLKWENVLRGSEVRQSCLNRFYSQWCWFLTHIFKRISSFLVDVTVKHADDVMIT